MSGNPVKKIGNNRNDFFIEAETNSCEITRKQKKNIPCQLEAEQGGRWKENLGAVAKYYTGITFVDPTYCCLRYTKMIYNKENIAYHIWEAGYLADKANIQWRNQKKLNTVMVIMLEDP